LYRIVLTLALTQTITGPAVSFKKNENCILGELFFSEMSDTHKYPLSPERKEDISTLSNRLGFFEDLAPAEIPMVENVGVDPPAWRLKQCCRNNCR